MAAGRTAVAVNHVARLNWAPIVVLGLVTIAAYGVAYYSYGVLIDPIHRATGWSDASLGGVFSAVLVIGGIGGLLGGRLADRSGARLAFLVAALPGAGGLLAASYAHDLLLFAALYAAGSGLIGATAFYHVTQPAAIRTAPAGPTRAVVVLTLFGALASPIFLPLTAWLVTAAGWRSTVRVEALIALVVLGLAACVIGPSRQPICEGSPTAMAAVLRTAWYTPGVRRWVAASLIGGAAVDVVLVFQVPVMVAAGLSVGLAAGVGALRGLAQFGGRLALGRALERFGTRTTVALTFVCGAVGVLCLLDGGWTPAAIAFAILAGASIGAISTLQGIHTNELVGDANLGLLMGAQQSVFAAGSAAGPALAGVLLSATHSYRLLVALTGLGFAVAAVMMRGRVRQRAAGTPRVSARSASGPTGACCCHAMDQVR